MNERLRRAMVGMRLDVEELSKQTNVDPKTVQRWLNGRVPHPRHRWKLAELLDVEEAYLWPEIFSAMVSPVSELIMAYARRSDADANAWWQLFL